MEHNRIELNSDFTIHIYIYLCNPAIDAIDIGIRKNSVHLCLHISRVALNLNFRAGSTFLVPVCTVSPGRWVNKADTQKDYSRCNMVDAVRLQVEFTFIAGSEVRDIDAKIYQESEQCNLFLKTKAYSF